MKKILTLVLLGLVCSTSYAQEIDTKQWTLFMKKTATWCPPCGGWGWNFFDAVYNAHKDNKVVLMNVHYSGELQNQVATDVSGIVPASGQPRFIVNNFVLDVYSGNMGEKKQEVDEIVEYNQSSGAFIGLGSDVVYDIGTGMLTAKSVARKLIDNDKTEFKIAHYLVKKAAVASQAGQNGDVTHKNVLAGSISNKGIGVDLVFDGVVNGSEANITVERKYQESDGFDPSDYIVYTVLWIPSSGGYTFYNATSTEISEVNAAYDTNNESLYSAFFGQEGDLMVDIDRMNSDQVMVELFDIRGQKTLSGMVSKTGRSTMDGIQLSQGKYIVVFTDGKTKISKKIIKY